MYTFQGGVADLLFEALPKSAAVQSAMVAALCKFTGDATATRASKIMSVSLALY